MAGREVCVCYYCRDFSAEPAQDFTSPGYLRQAGIVAARREGKWMHYSICTPADAAAASILAAALAALGNDRKMRADRARLDRAPAARRREVVFPGRS